MPRADNKRQIEGFKRIAREIGCDENEDAFSNVVRKIGKQKPATRPDVSRRAGRSKPTNNS